MAGSSPESVVGILNSSWNSTRGSSCVARQRCRSSKSGFIIVVMQHAKRYLQMFVLPLLHRDRIAKARSVLSRFVLQGMIPLWRKLCQPKATRGTSKLVKSCIHINGSLSPLSAVFHGPMHACLLVCPLLARYTTPSHSHAALQRLPSCFFPYIVSSGSECQSADGPICQCTVHACGCRRRAVWSQMGVSAPAKLRPLRDVE